MAENKVHEGDINFYEALERKKQRFFLALQRMDVALGLDMSGEVKETDVSKFDMEKEAFTPKPPTIE